MTDFGNMEPASQDRRGQKRSQARASVGFRQRGKTRISSRLLDLTTSGCKIRLSQSVKAGERVWVTLPTLESWSAQIAWVDDGHAGLEFEQPLHPAVADMVIKRAAVWAFTAAYSEKSAADSR